MDEDTVDYDYLIELQDNLITKRLALDELMWEWVLEWTDE